MTPFSPDETRLAVIGTSCAGKTTLARRLSALLGCAHVELDALHWAPGWTEVDDGVFRRRVSAAVAGDRWVADGNYLVVRDLVWSRATTIVWLNYPFPLVFGRALRRTVRRIVTREELFSGNRESFRLSFLSRESILLWVIRTHRSRRRTYRKLLAEAGVRGTVVRELRSPGDTAGFLEQVEATSARPPGGRSGEPR